MDMEPFRLARIAGIGILVAAFPAIGLILSSKPALSRSANIRSTASRGMSS